METRLDKLLAARGLSRKTLQCRVVSEKHRHTIAQEIGTDWETLAKYIEIPTQEVNDIKEEHTTNRSFALMRLMA